MSRPVHWPQVRPYGAQQRPQWPAGLPNQPQATLHAVSPYYLSDEARAVLWAEGKRIRAALAERRALRGVVA